MTHEKYKQCQSKGCCNIVLDGKFCEYHKRERKESRDKIWKGVGAVAAGAGVLAGAIAKNKDTIAEVTKKVLKK